MIPSMSQTHHELWNSIVAPRVLTEGQLAQLDRYLELLAKANETMNLTRVVDVEQARLLHVADALTLLPHIPGETKTLADVGSGGGVPGMILGIALPETRVHLIEATQKKAAFLKATAQALGLKNVSVHSLRAEDSGRTPLRDSCDVVTARAVGALVWLVEWGLPLCRKGGKLLAMKGPKLAEEMPAGEHAAKKVHGQVTATHPVTNLPGQTGHVICEIAKTGPTPAAYPRAATVAKGKPLV